MTDDDAPVARPTLAEGDLHVYSEEDIANAAAELFAWVRELEGVDDADAEEIATMMYELLTDGWTAVLDPDT